MESENAKLAPKTFLLVIQCSKVLRRNCVLQVTRSRHLLAKLYVIVGLNYRGMHPRVGLALLQLTYDPGGVKVDHRRRETFLSVCLVAQKLLKRQVGVMAETSSDMDDDKFNP